MAPRWDRDPAARGPVIQGVSARGFSVDGGIYEGLFLTPESAHEWRAPALEALTIEDLEPLLRLQPQPEFILLGTGARMTFAPRALVTALEARGVGLETMDSRAAARTWGVLRSEERWIAAGLMPLT